jgi:hypothetical protein
LVSVAVAEAVLQGESVCRIHFEVERDGRISVKSRCGPISSPKENELTVTWMILAGAAMFLSSSRCAYFMIVSGGCVLPCELLQLSEFSNLVKQAGKV